MSGDSSYCHSWVQDGGCYRHQVARDAAKYTTERGMVSPTRGSWGPNVLSVKAETLWAGTWALQGSFGVCAPGTVVNQTGSQTLMWAGDVGVWTVLTPQLSRRLGGRGGGWLGMCSAAWTSPQPQVRPQREVGSRPHSPGPGHGAPDLGHPLSLVMHRRGRVCGRSAGLPRTGHAV